MKLTTRIHLKVLWLLRTWPFRWAHKPLCSSFKEDVISFKGGYFCRSCSFLYAGVLFELMLILLNSHLVLENGVSLLIALLAFTLPFSYPRIYKKSPRLFRDILRFFLGVIIGLCICLFIEGQFAISLLVAGIALIFWKIYYIQRYNRKKKFCDSCHEFSDTQICSGFKLQADIIRDYEEEATNILLGSGYVPQSINEK